MEPSALVGGSSRRWQLQTNNLKAVYLDMPSPGMQRLFRQMGRMKSLIDSTVQKAIQQRAVEHEEHNRAQKKL